MTYDELRLFCKAWVESSDIDEVAIKIGLPSLKCVQIGINLRRYKVLLPHFKQRRSQGRSKCLSKEEYRRLAAYVEDLTAEKLRQSNSHLEVM
jgi:hypothetical protein